MSSSPHLTKPAKPNAGSYPNPLPKGEGARGRKDIAPRRVPILGVGIDDVTPAETLDLVMGWIDEGRRMGDEGRKTDVPISPSSFVLRPSSRYVVTPNPEIV